MVKQIISRGRESGGLYVLDPSISRPVACYGVTTPFEMHCRLGHPSLPYSRNYVLNFRVCCH